MSKNKKGEVPKNKSKTKKPLPRCAVKVFLSTNSIKIL